MSDYDYWDTDTGEGVSDYQLHKRFDEMLDETMDMARVGTLEYLPSTVLKAVDPVAYRVWFCDWVDAEIGGTITDEKPDDDNRLCGCGALGDHESHESYEDDES